MKYLIPGSAGDDVKALQVALNSRQEMLEVDGIYTEAVADAVKRVQYKSGEPINGVASINFQMKIGVKPWVEPKSPELPQKHKGKLVD